MKRFIISLAHVAVVVFALSMAMFFICGLCELPYDNKPATIFCCYVALASFVVGAAGACLTQNDHNNG